ncbi:MAG: beta-N-acetylhexosaminidase [Bacteroidaceae bacterium]|nr:beta-N-acetylhexosaminidase [Bacteroidaceae bacterium]
MKKISLLLFASVLSCAASLAQVSYDVIPLPRSVRPAASGEAFSLVQGATVTYASGNDQMASNARLLAEYLKLDAGLELTPKADVKRSAKKNAPLGAAVTLRLVDPNAKTTKKNVPAFFSDSPEAYRLTVGAEGVTIEGTTEEAVFRGIQTLRKAIGTQGGEAVSLPFVTIEDEPRFTYRGVHFDTARHYFPVDFIKQFLDVMALHGCNQFHWHLTEDQGWRFEVKSMPELAKKGSVRKTTVLGCNAGIYDGQPYGGYYTQQECREIVAYAAKLFINVIPEIDLPGHMLGALHVFPELGCQNADGTEHGPYEVWPHWGVSHDVLCAGNPKTLDFLKRVYDELCDVFPSKLIHIGGDECPRNRWKQCPRCQAKMKELGLTREAELQTYINKEMDRYLSAKGRTLIGWDETLEGGLSENAIVMSWRGMKGGIEAARQHHRVIMTPTDWCYIDYYQLKNDRAQPQGIGGYVPVSKVYSLEPVPEELSDEEAQYILGPQVNLWTEYVGYPEHAMYMLLPRLDAISEVQWMPKEQKDLEAFKARLPRMLELYRKLGYKYCYKQE